MHQSVCGWQWFGIADFLKKKRVCRTAKSSEVCCLSATMRLTAGFISTIKCVANCQPLCALWGTRALSAGLHSCVRPAGCGSYHGCRVPGGGRCHLGLPVSSTCQLLLSRLTPVKVTAVIRVKVILGISHAELKW